MSLFPQISKTQITHSIDSISQFIFSPNRFNFSFIELQLGFAAPHEGDEEVRDSLFIVKSANCYCLGFCFESVNCISYASKKWLDYYGPFEAVVDGANVGCFSQRRFKPSKVDTIANGIRQMLPFKKWSLVILHNRRITGDKMDEGLKKTLVEKWKTADALYATPTGSNDDWYWLYAAIKFKCLLVTNDEMRDHLFQLLGNDFFPKWKQRHQVRFNFCDTGPVYHMPPPCSVVIQEIDEDESWMKTKKLELVPC